MHLVVKDVTGEVFCSPESSKEQFIEEVRESYGQHLTEGDIAKIYRLLLNSFKEFKKMNYVRINVGTHTQEEYVTLNPEQIIYVKVADGFTEWEDSSDDSTVLDEPTLLQKE